eukprot:11213697-Lingulodinium_polyedra.AAC.1
MLLLLHHRLVELTGVHGELAVPAGVEDALAPRAGGPLGHRVRGHVRGSVEADRLVLRDRP